MNKLTLRKRIYNFSMAFLILAIESGIVSYVWINYYNTELPKAYYFWGHVFISAVYFAILLLVSVMYGGLKIGSYRMIELLFSQGFSTLLTDVIFYAIICLLAYHFPTPIPLLLGMILQGFLIGVWILAATYAFRALFPPIDMLLIYGGRDKEVFEQKVKTRRHQFSINETISADATLEELSEAVGRHGAVVIWDVSAELRNVIFKMCYEHSVEIYVSPKITDIILKGSANLHFFDSPLMLVKSEPIEPEQKLIKRVFDLVFSVLLAVIASPFMLITAICVKLYDHGSILYKQVRCTAGGKEFYIYKFRSMIEEAEKDGVARLASKGDDRITPVGHFIRRTRLDELPQLFNVIKGDMSFVGPRPERPEIIEQYKEYMPEFVYRTKVKAGITGYAQIYGKYNTSPYDKLKLDLFYIENYSIWLDIKLFILTVKTLFKFDSTEGVAQGMVTAVKEDENEQ